MQLNPSKDALNFWQCALCWPLISLPILLLSLSNLAWTSQYHCHIFYWRRGSFWGNILLSFQSTKDFDTKWACYLLPESWNTELSYLIICWSTRKFTEKLIFCCPPWLFKSSIQCTLCCSAFVLEFIWTFIAFLMIIYWVES